MELKQKWRRFWTLNRHHEDGFTLVELVVVIAILAILAAVTVPAYDDYITKAKESADEQIVAAVNTAFAAACVENKVDTVNVTEAAISVIDNKVQNLSSVTATETETSVAVDSATFNKIYTGFAFYYEGNEDAVFKNGVVNSLQWNPAVGGFEISATAVDTCILLSSGKLVNISPEDMEKIRNSAYGDMGYEKIAETITNMNKSSKTLYSIASGLGMESRFTAGMLAFGIIADESEADEMTAEKAGNALQLVTAINLAGASDAEIAELASKDLTSSYKLPFVGTVTDDSSTGLITALGKDGGTNTISAVALQYALVEGFANTEAGKTTPVEGYSSVSEFLASSKAQNDPVWAINQVKKTDAYTNGYVSSDPNSQYQKDISGFVSTMGVIGNNVSTTKNPDGAINTQDYLDKGIYSDDSKDVLTSVLGK